MEVSYQGERYCGMGDSQRCPTHDPGAFTTHRLPSFFPHSFVGEFPVFGETFARRVYMTPIMYLAGTREKERC